MSSDRLEALLGVISSVTKDDFNFYPAGVTEDSG